MELSITIDEPTRLDFRVTAGDIAAPGEAAQVLVLFSDITELREAEKMRTDFIANVSHELRSPLTAISGFVETLKNSARDDARARERFLGLMEHEARRMIALITDLLSLSRLEARERLKPEGETDMAAVLSRIAATLNDRAVEEGKKLVLLTANAPASIPGSEDELTQVFQNLIENAIKYAARDTEVTIETTMRDAAAGMKGPVLAVSVTDRGEGIAREHLPRLTERFYRVDTHRSRDKGGTGLGLAIVKHIVNRHRGRLLVTSEVGKGSTFTVLLPAGKTGT